MFINKPYIHYIDVKLMNNVSSQSNWTDTVIRQQAVLLDCSYNDIVEDEIRELWRSKLRNISCSL
jgi:hypothetical protein